MDEEAKIEKKIFSIKIIIRSATYKTFLYIYHHSMGAALNIVVQPNPPMYYSMLKV